MANSEGALRIFKAKTKGGQKSLKTVVVDHSPPFYGHVKVSTKKDVFAFDKIGGDHRNKCSR